ncbi:hypothetical protein B0T25DRAFT_528781 [Lasiosphaeria hispida]|uniref:Uncharacterized protein n=1 Tax=Lasiosphaeria hispida TaxID=260671 RepID=A0AAJ0MKN1_9PEZI|nr:hypothetical protein B0T25DRAFT_528781 [Lasiosphaeria hispida]
MPEPVAIVSAVGGVIAAAGRAVLHAADLVQTPEEVEAAAIEITKCQKKLGELISLRKKHAALLAQRPNDERSIEATIKETWEALGRAMPILERNKIKPSSRRSGTSGPPSSRNPASGFGKRLRWKVTDRNLYSIHEKAILRNQIEVRDQISRLEHIVRFGPFEAVAEQARVEERRRQDELDRARAEEDVKGLGYLDPVTVKELPPLSSTESLMSGTEHAKSSVGSVSSAKPGQNSQKSSLISGVVADLMALGVDDPLPATR